jgi:hypothetical protein
MTSVSVALNSGRACTSYSRATSTQATGDLKTAMTLTFERFPSFVAARKAFRARPCIYVQTDREENLLRIGECDNLWERYKGGTAYALDAAGHGAGSLYFVSDAPQDRKQHCRLEATLIYNLQPRYNNQHKKRAPAEPFAYCFAGDVPRGLERCRDSRLQ